MKAGWMTVKLGDVTKEFIVPQRDKPKNLCGDIPWCRIEDIDGIYLSGSKSGKGVTAKDVKEMPLRIFPAGTVIVSCSADLGRCAIVSKPLITNQTFLGIVPDETIDAKYLYYLLRSRAEQLNSMATGATIKYLSRDKFSSLEIPLPPLAEQKRIVALLDEAFAGIDEAKTNAETNRNNAQALLESHIKAIFTKRGPDWKEKKISDLSDHITVGFVGSMAHLFEEKGIPLLRGQNIRKHGIQFDNLKYISKETHAKWEKSALIPGDVAIVRVGYPGTAAVVPEGSPELNAASLVIVRPNPRLLDSYFLSRALNSEWGKSVIKARSVGAAQQVFNTGTAANLEIPLPTLIEQKDIVKRLDELSDETQRLVKAYAKKCSELINLKSALLAQAFAGELTA